MKRFFPFLMFGLVAVAFVPPGRAATGGPDPFGYTWIDSNSPTGPDYEWIDITATGDSVLSGTDVVGVVSSVSPPFVIYGQAISRIAISRHGYVSTNPVDRGTDNTNDCNLPVDPDLGLNNGEERPHRIYVTHDALEFDQNGAVFHEYFPVSPHPANNCGVHVITWSRVRHPSDPIRTNFSMQVLLFDNFDILMQFGASVGTNRNDGATSTTGIQRNTLQSGLTVACDTANSIPSSHAVLIEPPKLVVTTTADELDDPVGAQVSLREAVETASNGTRIEFAPALSGGIFGFDEDMDGIGNLARVLAIDASGLPARVRILAPLPDSDLADNDIFNFTGIGHLHLNGIAMANLFSGNIASAIQGGMTPVISHCSFDGFRDHAITSNSQSIYVTDCDFTDNNTTPGESFTANGGAISSPSNIVATDCRFTGNRAERTPGSFELLPAGGAVFASGVILDGCTFTGNRADGEGGAVGSNGSVNAVDCVFNDNAATNPVAGEGGAIHARGIVIVRSSVFESNTAGWRGGALEQEGNGYLTVDNGAFRDNRAPRGGAVFVVSTHASIVPQIRNSTFVGNAEHAVEVQSANGLSVRHCAFKGNTAEGAPASLLRAAGVSVGGTSGFNVFDDAPPGFGGGGSLTNTDARLALAPFYVPRSNSPLINAGDPNFPLLSLPLDIRGFPRVDTGGGVIDIGCYEVVGTLDAVVTTAVDENVNPGTGLSLREALAGLFPGGRVTFAPSLDGAVIDAVATHQLPEDAIVSADDLPNGITLDVSGLTTGVRMQRGSTLSGVHVRDAATVGIEANHATTVADCEITGCRIGLLVRGDVVNGLGTFRGENLRVSGNGGNGVTAVEIRDDVSVTFEDCDFTDNVCTNENGGALRGGDEVSLTLRSCLVMDNSADTGQGGGVFLGADAIVLLYSSTVARNRSGHHGGGLFLGPSSYLRCESTTLSGNIAERSGVACVGGGIYLDAGTGGVLSNSTLVGNHARSNSGGTGAAAGAIIHYSGSIIAANTAGSAGGVDNLANLAQNNSLGYNLLDSGELAPQVGDLLHTDPLLGPLACYGSPDGRALPVHAPLAISPALDANLLGSRDRDQRGYPGVRAGLPGGSQRMDIGAVELGVPVVVDTADDQAGGPSLSLREALTLAGAGENRRILFAPALDGATIGLSSGLGGQGAALTVTTSFQIDATTLPSGITLSGGGAVRALIVNPGVHLAMHAVSITQARRAQGGQAHWGSAINALAGSGVTYTHGCIHGCTSVASSGTIALQDASLVLSNATLTGNHAEGGGSGFLLSGDSAAYVEHSAVTGNTTGASNACVSMGTSPVTALSSIFAENTHSTGLRNFNTSDGGVSFGSQFRSLGYNLTGNLNGAVIDGGFDGPGDLRVSEVGLGTLTDKGGWALVVTLDSSSPAVDGGNPRRPRIPVFDQRGFARVADGVIDIGPYETNGDTQDSDGDLIPDWWENLHGLDPASAADAADDPDGDGEDNLSEYENGTDPRVSDATAPLVLRLTGTAFNPGTRVLTVFYETGGTFSFVIETSGNLENWSIHGLPLSVAPGAHSVTLMAPQTNADHLYVRLRRL